MLDTARRQGAGVGLIVHIDGGRSGGENGALLRKRVLNTPSTLGKEGDLSVTDRGEVPQGSHYDLLGLEIHAPSHMVAASVRGLSHQADALAYSSPERSRELWERIRQIKEDLLLNRARREEYDAGLISSTEHVSSFSSSPLERIGYSRAAGARPWGDGPTTWHEYAPEPALLRELRGLVRKQKDLAARAVEESLRSKSRGRHETTVSRLARHRFQHVLKYVTTRESPVAEPGVPAGDRIAEETRNVAANLAELIDRTGYCGARWSDPAWDSWCPVDRSGPLVRIGEFMTTESTQYGASIPAFIPFPGAHNIFIAAPDPATKLAMDGLYSFVLRLLALVPPGKLDLTIIGPRGNEWNIGVATFEGTGISAFRGPAEPDEIDTCLARLEGCASTVLEKYLNGRYPTIDSFHADIGKVVEPYRVVVVQGFPPRFSPRAAQTLTRLAVHGPRCGIYTAIVADTGHPLPDGLDLPQIEDASTVIAWNGSTFQCQDEDFGSYALQFDDPPESSIIDRINRAVVGNSRFHVPSFRSFAEGSPSEQRKHVDPDDGLCVPLGWVGRGHRQYLELGVGHAQNALLGGSTSCPPSDLLEVICAGLIRWYGPNDVDLRLADLGSETQLYNYARNALPGPRGVCITEREETWRLLENIDHELVRRERLFRVAGIAHYRTSVNSEPNPRIVLMINAFEQLIFPDDAMAANADAVLNRLVQRGHAVGIHIVLASEKLARAYLRVPTLLSHVTVRVARRCGRADAQVILGLNNPVAELLDISEAVYNTDGTREGNRIFWPTGFDDHPREHFVSTLQAHSKELRPSYW